MTLTERFWSKVRKTDGCWEWIAGTAGRGYGIYTTRKPHREYAHRLIYEDQVGPIPAGYDIDHLCRNIRCVNPAHLEAVTHQENLRRGQHPWKLRTACAAGHTYTPETMRWYGKYGRNRKCLICVKRLNRAAYLRRKSLKDASNGVPAR